MASIRQALRGLKDRDSGIISITPARILIMSPKGPAEIGQPGGAKKKNPSLNELRMGKKLL